jgi:hypothetical protein
VSDAAPWEDYAAPAASGDPGPWNDYAPAPPAPPRVGWAEENLAGPGELITNTVANIPHAAAHAAVDLYRRWTGGDTNAPDPTLVQKLEPTQYLPSAGGQQLAGDISSMLNPPKDSNSIDSQIDAIRAKALGPQNATVGDVINQTGVVAGDVANLVVAGQGVKALTGLRTASTAADAAAAAKPVPAPPTNVPDVPGASPPIKFDEAPPPLSASGSPRAAPFTALDTAPVPKAAESAPAAPAPPPVLATELPPDVQAQRAATLKAAGLTEARTSAIVGDAKSAATDFQQSKLDTDGGKVLSDALGKERETLGRYTDDLVAKSGGSTGLDETSLHNRGSVILQPLQDLSDNLDNRIKALYGQADDAANGMPTELPATSKALADRAAFIGTTDGQQLLRGVNAYLRQAGIADDAGTIGSATVQQAERLKQYLNDQWSPRTGRLIGKIKDAIDDDVTSSAGTDVYDQARATRRLRATLLDEPKGVSSLLDSSGPGGINRAVNVEKIPDAVARMPVDQFGHVVDTLNKVPTEVQPQAQAALGEIRSQFMQRMQEKGQAFKGNQWNNRGVTQYLNANSAKLAKVFSPSELQQLKTLNDAGNILDIDRAYPGSAVQGHNLLQRGAIKGVEHGGALVGEAIGSSLGAPGVGTLFGSAAGKLGAKALEGSMSRKAALARFQKL